MPVLLLLLFPPLAADPGDGSGSITMLVQVSD
jgi:hypothetical protein